MSDQADTARYTDDFLDHLNRRANAHTDFDAAIRPLMKPLLAYFARRITPQDDAADCLSEVLTVLWRRRKELPDTEEGTRRWAYGIAKGVLANAVRGKVRRTALADRIRIVDHTTAPAELDLDVQRALEQLNGIDQELIRLVIWDGFGIAEAGALLGLRPGAARSRYSRARTQLRGLLT